MRSATWSGRFGTETGTIKLPIMGPTGLDGKTEGLEERAEVVRTSLNADTKTNVNNNNYALAA